MGNVVCRRCWDRVQIASRAARMMTVIVEVFGAYSLTVLEKKTETLLMQAPEKAQQPGETPTPPLSALEITAVSEKKAETLLMRAPEKAQQPGETPTPPLPALEIAAAGQKYHQVHQSVYLGGLVTEDADTTRYINHRTKIARGCFRKFSTELFDRSSALIRLEAGC